MTANDLPDELIREILAPALRVSDAEFANTDATNCFSTISESTSALLLVCKRWLRVSTPLLYEVIVLRSKAQAQHLHLALRRNKAFGQHTRKLRIEGGFGSIMDGIIAAMPHIEDLFLSLEIYSSDNTSGLAKALPRINPQRVILLNGKNCSNVQSNRLFETVCNVLKDWTNMTTLVATTRRGYDETIARAVSTSQNLHTIQLHIDSWYWIDMNVLLQYEKCPRIKSIQLFSPNDMPSYVRDKFEFRSRPALKALLTTKKSGKVNNSDLQNHPDEMEIDYEPILSSTGLTSFALSSASVQDSEAVFARIIFFYLNLDQLSFQVKASDFPSLVDSSRCAISLVSKMFHRLSIPYLYRYPIIPYRHKMKLFCATVASNTGLALYIRRMFISTGESRWYVKKTSGSSIPERLKGGITPDYELHLVLKHASNLIQLSAIEHIDNWGYYRRHNIGWNAFLALAKVAGSTLQKFEGIHVDPPLQAQLGKIFQDFTQLRSLHWNTNTSFQQPSVVSSKCFATLEDLTVGIHCVSFFKMLSDMELPALRELNLTSNMDGFETFLAMHGHKIHTLGVPDSSSIDSNNFALFDICPALCMLKFSRIMEPPPLAFFCLKTPHASLTKVVMTQQHASYSGRNTPNFNSSTWKNFFATVDFSSFPVLHELHMPGPCVWPSTEHDILKSIWPGRAERLAGLGVHLTNLEGRRWKARLKRVGRL